MNIKRYVAAALALFAFIFLYEFVVHGFLLLDMYQATPNVWRDFAEMEANWPTALFFQLALAVWAAFIFTQLFHKSGIKNGLLFGLFFGVFAGLLTASWYMWLPVSPQMGWIWFFSGLTEGLGGGIVLGSVYRQS